MSLRPCTRVSIKRISRKTVPGQAMPSSTPSRRIWFLRGETGALPPSALSITRALLSAIACDRAFSSRRFSRKRYSASLIFCCRSMESISRSFVGMEATRLCACISRLCASRRFTSRLTIMLSTARMMLCFMERSELFSSSTTGFRSLLSSVSLSRRSFNVLYWLIELSIFMSLIPVFEGIRSTSLLGSVR